MFKALADPTRRLIIDELLDSDGQSLFELCGRLTMKHGTTSSRQAISQHLALLEEAGLVRSHRVDARRSTTSTPHRCARSSSAGTSRTDFMPRITMTSVFVDDQARALAFYTDVLGFVVKNDIPLGEHRWLTVVGAGEPDGVELLLEPDEHPAAKQYMRALVADGIPAASFGVDDVETEHERLSAAECASRSSPRRWPVVTAVLDDTCGNLIQLTSPARE